MSHLNMSSALSDDGKFSTRALKGFGAQDDYAMNEEIPRNTKNRGDIGDNAIGYSTHVEISDKGSRRFAHPQNDDGGVIEDIEEENDENSVNSPPGTIGEVHDYMSENIESNQLHRLKKQKIHGNQSAIGKVQQTVTHIARNGEYVENQEMSVTGYSNLAVIKEKIPLTDGNKHIQAFKHTYDTLFAEFQQRLMSEYKMMKQTYISEYQENYQENLIQKQTNIDSFMEDTIGDKKKWIIILERQNDQLLSQVQRFYDMKDALSTCQLAFQAWHKYYIRQKGWKRKRACYWNTFNRWKLTKFFRSWRGVTREWGRERIKIEQVSYRKEVETSKLTMWTSKVDQLMLYMAQLEDKIKIEVQAREHLSQTYDGSLQRGVSQFNQETILLADNPLIREISLVVARQLLHKKQEDPEGVNALLTQQQRLQLAQLQEQMSVVSIDEAINAQAHQQMNIIQQQEQNNVNVNVVRHQNTDNVNQVQREYVSNVQHYKNTLPSASDSLVQREYVSLNAQNQQIESMQMQRQIEEQRAQIAMLMSQREQAQNSQTTVQSTGGNLVQREFATSNAQISQTDSLQRQLEEQRAQIATLGAQSQLVQNAQTTVQSTGANVVQREYVQNTSTTVQSTGENVVQQEFSQSIQTNSVPSATFTRTEYRQ